MSEVSRWKFTTTVEAAWEEMFRACEGAQKSIDINQFVFGRQGPVIERLSKILRAKAAEGVKVRLLLDAVGSFVLLKSDVCAELEKAGVEIIFHKTLFPPSIRRIIPSVFRDHRKLIIVDSREAHIGGVIISELARTWRDTQVILEGSIVDACCSLFEASWKKTGKLLPLGQMIKGRGNGDFFLAGNSFRSHDRDLYRLILENIRKAQHTVYITVPYFTLSRGLKRGLWLAKARGVDVRLLFPKRSDNLVADITVRFFYKSILKKGIRIFHYTDAILHAKTISIDSSWSTVGSCNLDLLSIWVNYELNLVSENKDFAQDLDTIFSEDLQKSTEVTLHTRGWYGFF